MDLIKNKKSKHKKDKKIFSTILLTSAVWAFAISGLGYINQYTKIKTISFDFAKQTIPVYASTRELEKGEIIKEKDIKIKDIETNFATIGAICDIRKLVGKQTTHKIYKNEQITPSDIIEPKIIKDNLIAYTLPINLLTLHDNNIKPNDYVDIIIDYKEKLKKTRSTANGKTETYKVNKPSEIVASKVLVTQIIDNKGNKINPNQVIQKPQDKQQPALATVLVNKNLINNLNDAKKRGNLLLIKYLNVEHVKEKENYKPSWQE